MTEPITTERRLFRVMAYDCPKCGAAPEESCRAPSGRKVLIHHARTVAAFRANDLYNATFNPTGRLGAPDD